MKKIKIFDVKDCVEDLKKLGITIVKTEKGDKNESEIILSKDIRNREDHTEMVGQ